MLKKEKKLQKRYNACAFRWNIFIAKNKYNNMEQPSPYKWWVTPTNLLLISTFLFIVDYTTKQANGRPYTLNTWSTWGILLIWLLFAVKEGMTRHPRTAWLFVPSIMFVIAIYLLILDWAKKPNKGPLGLDFAIIPASALIIFGTLIPIVSKLGKKEPTPLERFAKIEPLSQLEEEK